MSNKPEKTTLVKDPALAPVTNEELLELHTSQSEVIATLQAKIAQLESDKEAALTEMSALSTAQNEAITDLQTKIADLENEKAAVSKSGGGVIVTIKGAQYRVVHGLLTNGTVVSPVDIAADEDLCEMLLEQCSSAVKPV